MYNWTPHNFRVLMADPVGFAKVQGMAFDNLLGLHIGLTHWVDVTHIPSGRKVAQFRTIAGAARFVETLVKLEPERLRGIELTFSVIEIRAIQDLIASERVREEEPCREPQ